MALIWSCSEYFKFLNLQYFWILSKTPYLTSAKLNDMLNILTSFDINISYMIKNDLFGCN